jgi:hypothetical protein
MTLSSPGMARSAVPFRDANRLEVFQRDMETLLLKTGWMPRPTRPIAGTMGSAGYRGAANARRRWWTDGRSDEPVETPQDSTRRREDEDEQSVLDPPRSRLAINPSVESN